MHTKPCAKAKTANDMKSRHYYMTKQQRANMAGGSDNIPPVLVIETVGDTTQCVRAASCLCVRHD